MLVVPVLGLMIDVLHIGKCKHHQIRYGTRQLEIRQESLDQVHVLPDPASLMLQSAASESQQK